jgi:hypothetical protein
VLRRCLKLGKKDEFFKHQVLAAVVSIGGDNEVASLVVMTSYRYAYSYKGYRHLGIEPKIRHIYAVQHRSRRMSSVPGYLPGLSSMLTTGIRRSSVDDEGSLYMSLEVVGR